MKKIAYILLIAASCLAFSCVKEQIASENGGSDPDKFVCFFETNKTSINSDNNCLWQEGDYIILYNGDAPVASTGEKLGSLTFNMSSNPVFYNGSYTITNLSQIIEKIDITADMISDGGKKLTFKKTIDDAKSSYYALAESKGSNHIYSLSTSGKVGYREVSSHTDTGAGSTEFVFSAVAKSPAGTTELTFRNVFCQLKFDVSKGKYKKVTFEANAGSANKFVCGISGLSCDMSSIGSATDKNDPYTIYLNNTDAGPYYVPVAPNANLDKGITIKCYKSDTDSAPYTINLKSKFPLARNTIINLGNLDQVKPVGSLYTSWEDGNDIIINGVAYNKKTIGDGHHITSDTVLAANEDTKGAYFVDEGVTLTLSSAVRPKGSTIIMCDKPGKKANFNVSATFIPQVDNASYVVNSMNVNFPGTGNAFTYASRPVALVGFYSSKIQINVNNFALTANSTINSAEFVGCDISLGSAVTSAAGIFVGTQSVKNGSVVFKNNIVYSPDGTTRNFYVYRENRSNSILSTLGTAEILNNTFYDIMFQWGFLHPVSADAAYVENNIVSYTAANDQYQRFLWTSGDDGTTSRTTPAAGYPDQGRFLNNISFNTSRVLGVMNYACNLGGKSWYPAGYREVTSVKQDPFLTKNAANGIFTPIDEYAAYGAQRDASGNPIDPVSTIIVDNYKEKMKIFSGCSLPSRKSTGLKSQN